MGLIESLLADLRPVDPEGGTTPAGGTASKGADQAGGAPVTEGAPSPDSSSGSPADLTGADGRVDPADLETPGHVRLLLGVSVEEFVVDLLERHDGQLRQSSFTEHTNWSKATVSRVLTDLEDEGHVSRIRLGRENVVTLPGHVPSPRSDEE